MILYTLLLIVMTHADAVVASTRQFDSMEACQEAADAAQDAAARAPDVQNLGTLCVKSDFSKSLKPRA